MPDKDEPPKPPSVTLAILVQHPDELLPFYLMCVLALDYPKDRIALFARVIADTGSTAEILSQWIARVRSCYAAVDFSPCAPTDDPQRTLRDVRRQSLQLAMQNGSDFYFVIDSDNFVNTNTLRALVEVNLPIVAPLLRHDDQAKTYANYHGQVDGSGYYKDTEEYYWLFFQRVTGLCRVPLVLGTYLVRRDVMPRLSYEDGSNRPDYVVFAESARRQNIPQFLDNRQVYGYMSVGQPPTGAFGLIGESVAISARNAERALVRAHHRTPVREADVTPVFIHSSWRTSGTWFWTKFRNLPSTIAFYEPLSHFLYSITRTQALENRGEADFGHPVTDPYFLEYVPLIHRSAGMRLYDGRIAYEWFVPDGGLLGTLRQEERRYLAFLLREASQRGRVPVMKFCRSLGRIAAIKREFPGLHVFLFRNLWHQWVSYMRVYRRGDTFFRDTVPLIANRTDDPFLCQVAGLFMARSPACRGDVSALIGSEQGYHVLAALPEQELFGLFMATHVYLYLHAHRCADLVVDINRIAREPDHRRELEGDFRDRVGVRIRLDDIRDQTRTPRDAATRDLNWSDIFELGELAARMLAERVGADDMSGLARQFIFAAEEEAHVARRAPVTTLAQ